MSEAEAPTISQDELETLQRELSELRGTKATYETALDSERRRRIEAERARMGDAERYVASQQDACEETLSRLEIDIEALTSRYAELADEPGNGRALAEISRKLAQSEARIVSETDRKERLAMDRERAKADTARASQPTGKVLANGSPLEAIQSAAQKAWLEKHDRAFTDVGYLNRVNAAANAASVLKGLTTDTPEWFAAIEEAIGEHSAPAKVDAAPADDGDDVVATVDSPYSSPRTPPKPSQSDELAYNVANPQHRAAGPGSIAAAPPSRSIPGATPQRGQRTPKLTAEEREVADSMYAKIPNAADRYAHYVKSRDFMASRQPSHFVN